MVSNRRKHVNNSGYYAATLNYRLCIKAVIFHAVELVSRLHCLLCKAEISKIFFVVFFFFCRIKFELRR